MIKVSLAVFVLAGVCHVARAEPVDSPKSPDAAAYLSVLGTLAPIAIMSGGVAIGGSTGTDVWHTGLGLLMVGPSFGHWYAHKPVTFGMPVRLLGGALLLRAIDRVNSDTYAAFLDGREVLGSLAVIATGTVLDLLTSGSAAEDYNREHALAIAPTIVRGARSQSLGLGLAASF